MTKPLVFEPSKAKAWTATIGSLIISVLPLIGQAAEWLPAPYGAVLTGIGLILSALTGTATHQARYKPKDTVIVSADSVRRPEGVTDPHPVTDPNPWA